MEELNFDDVILNKYGSRLVFDGSKGLLTLIEGVTEMATSGRYCHILLCENTNEYYVEMNNFRLNATKDSIVKLRKHVTASAEDEFSNDFYCSSFNGFWLEEDPRDEYTWFPATGSDVLISSFEESNVYNQDTEEVVLTNCWGEIRYPRITTKVINSQNQFYIGEIFNMTEISKQQYEKLKSSNRASSLTIEHTLTFGDIESFSLCEPPTKGNLVVLQPSSENAEDF